MVHTSFYNKNEVSNIYELMKLDLEKFIDREDIMSKEEDSFYDYFISKFN